MTQRLVFMVPGFFGFTSIGAVSYFEDVQQVLTRALRRRGIEARVVTCTTQPTASIPRRADGLRRQVIASGGLKAQELHFIGHSTGGLDDCIGRNEGPFDRIAAGVLRRIRFDRRDPVWKYLGEIERDQGAVLQLTPEGIELFDAAVTDRAGIDYGCVVSGVPRPREQFRVKELMDPEFLAMRSLFRLLHALTAKPHPRYPYPEPARRTQSLLDRGLGFKATPGISDGIVPTLSQLHGRVLHVVRADHLDVVGHYTLAGGSSGNWLPSGAGFSRDAFDATWDAVAAAIARK